jgi:hypothetical protein
MQVENEKLRSLYYGDLKVGNLSEHKEKFPPHPSTRNSTMKYDGKFIK